jgi:transposase
MEACGGSHHLARLLREQGHDARIIPAQFVKPFVKSQKNDFLDAEAIAEAVQRPTMRFVPIKTEEQLDMQTLHRVRDRLVGQRTALINQVRAILLERGLTFNKGRQGMTRLLPELLAAGSDEVSPGMHELLKMLWDEWQDLDRRLSDCTRRIEAVMAQDEVCQKLATVPGIGPLTATALVAAVADGSMFRCARDLSAWLGLVPRQRSTGGKTKLLGISKRGNSYLRRLLILGAQSARLNLNRDRHPRLGEWLTRLEQRAHRNTAVVALANKLARTAWVILRQGCTYNPAFGRPTAA